jgi:putative sporulation protein YtaF
MPYGLSLLLLALAVSLDGLGVGVTYGMRKIRIPWFSIVIISLCSGTILFVSMFVGMWAAGFLSPAWARGIGALILIAIGCWALFQVLKSDPSRHKPAPGHDQSPKTVFQIELRSLGLVIHILRKPQLADLDGSGVISPGEALWLGVALSLDAFGAGIGAALIGFTPLWTALMVAVSCGGFMLLGLRIGFRFAEFTLARKLTFLPGCLFILMGILKLL